MIISAIWTCGYVLMLDTFFKYKDYIYDELLKEHSNSKFMRVWLIVGLVIFWPLILTQHYLFEEKETN